MAPFDFEGRVAVVTGAARGIGRATAQLLAESGATVVVADRDGDGARQAAAAITITIDVAGGAGRAEGVELDVGRAAEVTEVVEGVVARHGRVDFLVNNAGISLYRPILECSEADWDAHVDSMAKGTFLMTRAVGPVMVAQRFGRIVNLGSYVAQLNCTTKYFGPYCAAKFAVVGLTQVAAQELAPHVTVNAVGPGDVATEMMEREWEQEGERRGEPAAGVKDRYRRRLLLGELEQPEDIAQAIAFLCSPLAAHVTGSHLIVSGGLPFTADRPG